jgi:hypothetical protein
LRLDELKLAKIEGGLSFLPFFGLRIKPYELAGLLQTGIIKINSDFRVKFEDEKEDPKLVITLKDKAEEEGFDIFADRIVHEQNLVPFKKLSEYIKAVNEVYNAWIEITGLNEKLCWVGLRFGAIFFFHKNKNFALLGDILDKPHKQLEKVILADNKNAAIQKTEFRCNWAGNDPATDRKKVYDVRFWAEEDSVRMSLDLRVDVRLAKEIELAHNEAVRLFSELMRQDSIKRMMDETKKDSRILVDEIE